MCRLVVDVPALPADPPAGQPADELLGGHLDADGEVHAGAMFGERGVEDLGLGAIAREPVEDRAVGGVGLRQACQQHADGRGVGDEFPALHVGLRLEPDGRPVANGRTEQVAAGDVRHPEAPGEPDGLGALAGSRTTQEDRDAHGRPFPTRPRRSGSVTG